MYRAYILDLTPYNFTKTEKPIAIHIMYFVFLSTNIIHTHIYIYIYIYIYVCIIYRIILYYYIMRYLDTGLCSSLKEGRPTCIPH